MAQLLLLVSVLLWAASILPSAWSECNIGLCQSQIPTNGTKAEQCEQAKNAIDCAVNTLLKNPDCNPNIRQMVQSKVEDGRKQVKELCGGAAALMPPIIICLTVSSLAYFVTFF